MPGEPLMPAIGILDDMAGHIVLAAAYRDQIAFDPALVHISLSERRGR